MANVNLLNIIMQSVTILMGSNQP